MSWCFVLFLLPFVVGCFTASEDLLVKVDNGFLKGQHMYTYDDQQVRGFLSIPYAQAPIGKLRFKPPQPALNWTGVRDATVLHDACIQTILGSPVTGQEDCLFLNVFAPLPASQNETVSNPKPKWLPVMVYIHGGDFNYHYGGYPASNPRFLLDYNVVVVSFNYRLGALGFLSTGDRVVPGNNGLKDQTFALKWIQKNIKCFGGDPNSVTLFGISAGGASVRFHMFSPLSKGLFHAAISESGTELCNWSLTTRKNAIRYAKKMASNCHCPVNNTTAMIDCLRNVEAHKIVQYTGKYEEYNIVPITYLYIPVIEIPHEGAFIDDYPWNILKNKRGSDVPNINGVNHDEGAINVAAMNSIPKMFDDMEYNFERMIPYSLIFDVDVDRDAEIDLSEEIRQFYFGRDDLNETKMQNLIDVYTDTTFFVCAVESTKLSMKYAKSQQYFYMFDYNGVYSMADVYGDPTRDYGVAHADEKQYLFDLGYRQHYKSQSKNDMRVMKMLTKMWTNFATYKNPTPFKFEWKPVSSSNVEYLHIRDYNDTTMQSNLWKNRLDFWYKLCDKYSCKIDVSKM